MTLHRHFSRFWALGLSALVLSACLAGIDDIRMRTRMLAVHQVPVSSQVSTNWQTATSLTLTNSTAELLTAHRIRTDQLTQARIALATIGLPLTVTDTNFYLSKNIRRIEVNLIAPGYLQRIAYADTIPPNTYQISLLRDFGDVRSVLPSTGTQIELRYIPRRAIPAAFALQFDGQFEVEGKVR